MTHDTNKKVFETYFNKKETINLKSQQEERDY